MKKLLAAAALATILATPAFAQMAPRPYAPQNNFSQTDRNYVRQRHSVNPNYDVYEQGQYQGSDPDPNIRSQIRREPDLQDSW
jgi:hypothetical protein